METDVIMQIQQLGKLSNKTFFTSVNMFILDFMLRIKSVFRNCNTFSLRLHFYLKAAKPKEQ